MRSSAERVEPPLKPDWREHGGQAVLIVRDSRVRRAHRLVRLPTAWVQCILSIDMAYMYLPSPASPSVALQSKTRSPDWQQRRWNANT